MTWDFCHRFQTQWLKPRFLRHLTKLIDLLRLGNLKMIGKTMVWDG